MNQVGGTLTDNLIKMVFVVFVSLLSFSVGTFVGVKFKDSQNKLAALEGHVDRSTASIPPEATESVPEELINDATIEQLKKEAEAESPTQAEDDHAAQSQAKAQNDHSEHSEAKAQEGHSAHSETKVQDGHSTQAKVENSHIENKSAKAESHAKVIIAEKAIEKTTHKEVAKTEKPQEAATQVSESKPIADKKHEAQRIPSSLPGAVSGSTIGKYTVQIASYSSESEAQKKVNDLKTIGYAAFTVPADVNGKIWYRVSVGSFSTRNEATTYLGSTIKRDLKISNAIVQKIIP